MRTAVVIQHVPHEDCGRLSGLLEAAGFSLRDCPLHLGASLPDAVADELWVVMGGPMGVGDIGDARYAFLAGEAAGIARRLQARRPVLGICLGAQLLAHAAGARVYPNRRKEGLGEVEVLEVGWEPVRLLHAGQEPAWAGLQEQEMVLHWHGDTFDLPDGGVHLASTERCHHQAYRIGHHAYGLQFHPEVLPETIPRWIAEDRDYVVRARIEGVWRLQEDTRALGDSAGRSGERMLANILAAMGFPALR